MEIRIDEVVNCADDVKKLGIESLFGYNRSYNLKPLLPAESFLTLPVYNCSDCQ